MKDKRGGPAFPTPEEAFGGMTLRDYFAAKAMQVILSQCEVIDSRYYEQDAAEAYDIADAMLKARNA